ncbi:MAG: hypothetical protein ACI865_003067 [Flavobacteriaceae bacterium]|jgi:hypothetical protein
MALTSVRFYPHSNLIESRPVNGKRTSGEIQPLKGLITNSFLTSFSSKYYLHCWLAYKSEYPFLSIDIEPIKLEEIYLTKYS